MSQAHLVAEESKYMSHAEVDLIQELALQLPLNATCVNLGCGPGTSIVALLEARTDLAVYSIDYKPSKNLEQFKRAGIQDRVIEIVGDSHQVMWEYAKIDWLCVDTDHRYSEITKEILKWIPLCRGQVLFHDYNFSMGAKEWQNVQQAVDEWAQDRKPLGISDSLIVFDLSKEK